MSIKQSTLRAAVSAAFLFSVAGAQAAMVTCPQGQGGRSVTVTGALANGLCYSQDGNLDAGGELADGIFNPTDPDLYLLEKDVVSDGAGPATSGLLKYTIDGNQFGTWSTSVTGQNLYLGFHFGNGGGSPDSFIVQLDPAASSGTWSFSAPTGMNLTGLSNIYLFSDKRRPPNETPEPGTLALVGLGMLAAGAAARRRKA